MCLFLKRAGFGFWILVSLPAPLLADEEAKATAYPRRLVCPLEFVDGMVSGEVSDASLAALLNRKLVVGAEDGYEFLRKQKATANIKTETISEYRAAIAQGARPRTNFEISMASYFVEAGGALRFLENCRDAKKSAFKDAWLQQLSTSMLEEFDSDQEAGQKRGKSDGVTLANYAKNKKLLFTKSTPDRLEFEYGSRLYVVTYAASGDYDGDGFEDRLISVAWYYKESSGRSYATYVALYADPSESAVSLTEFDHVAPSPSDEVD